MLLGTPSVIRMCPPLTTKNWSIYVPLLVVGTTSGSVGVVNLYTKSLHKELSVHTCTVRCVVHVCVCVCVCVCVVCALQHVVMYVCTHTCTRTHAHAHTHTHTHAHTHTHTHTHMHTHAHTHPHTCLRRGIEWLNETSFVSYAQTQPNSSGQIRNEISITDVQKGS